MARTRFTGALLLALALILAVLGCSTKDGTMSVDTPSITPQGGSYSTPQNVTLASTTAGAQIRYTLDGTNPSTTVGTLYAAPFTVDGQTTVKAVAYTGNGDSSLVTGASFDIVALPPLALKTVAVSWPTLSAYNFGAPLTVTTLFAEDAGQNAALANGGKGQLVLLETDTATPVAVLVAYVDAAAVAANTASITTAEVADGFLMSSPVVTGYSNADKAALLALAKADADYAGLVAAIEAALTASPLTLLDDMNIYTLATQLIAKLEPSLLPDAKVALASSVVGSPNFPHVASSATDRVKLANPSVIFYAATLDAQTPSARNYLVRGRENYVPNTTTYRDIGLSAGEHSVSYSKGAMNGTSADEMAAMANTVKLFQLLLDSMAWCPVSNEGIEKAVEKAYRDGDAEEISTVMTAYASLNTASPNSVVANMLTWLETEKNWKAVTKYIYNSADDEHAAKRFLKGAKKLFQNANNARAIFNLLNENDSQQTTVPFLGELINRPSPVNYCIELANGEVAPGCVTPMPPIATAQAMPQGGGNVYKTGYNIFFTGQNSTDPDGPTSSLWYRWDFEGDGTPDTAWSLNATAVRVYTDPGLYGVILYVKDGDSNVSTAILNLNVIQKNAPVAVGAATPSTGADIKEDIAVNFSAQGSYDSDLPGGALTFRWDFNGDSTFDTQWSSLETASYTYANPGSYTAWLEVRDVVGNVTRLSLPLVVKPKLAPVASFTAVTSQGPDLRQGVAVNFDASATTDPDNLGGPLSYRWDFNGDGTFDTSWASSPLASYIYAAGTFTAKLEVLDADSLTGQATTSLVINPKLAPTPVFSASPSFGSVLRAGINTLFDASGTSDPDGSPGPLAYRWDYNGDGTYDTEWMGAASASFNYNAAGNYNATLMVRDSDNLSATYSSLLFMNPRLAPVATGSASPSFGQNYQVNVPVNFTAAGSTDPDTQNGTLWYRWDFNGFGHFDTDWSTTPTGQHTYLAPGRYLPTVEVKDQDGLVTSFLFSIDVLSSIGLPPVAIATADPSSGPDFVPNLPILFDGSASFDPNNAAAVLSYRWDFDGNGTFDTAWTTTPTASYTYTVGGNYEAVLEVRNEGQLTSSFTLNLIVGAQSGQITGRVTNATTTLPVVGATINIYDPTGTTLQDTQITNSNGQFTSDELSEGSKLIVISAPGYLPVTQTTLVVASQITQINATLIVQDTGTPTGSAAGRIVNATNGSGVGNVSISLRSGILLISDTGGAVVATTTTDSGGNFSFSNLNAGIYTGFLTSAGYQPDVFTLIVVGGTTRTGQVGSMNPLLSAGEVRIILTWGPDPRDLDSHLTGPSSAQNGSRFHVYYGYLSTPDGYQNLDLDDTSGYGPETTTIRRFFPGTYRFTVHHYSGASTIGNSGAMVRVITSTTTTTFNATPGASGSLWAVFDIDGSTGAITPVNQYSNSSSIYLTREVVTSDEDPLLIFQALPPKE